MGLSGVCLCRTLPVTSPPLLTLEREEKAPLETALGASYSGWLEQGAGEGEQARKENCW